LAFRGTFEHTLDAKNRLTVPAKFRASLADGLVLAKGVEPCLAIWRPGDYDQLVRRSLEGHHPLSPQVRQLKRFFSSSSVDLELDAAGRIGLPSHLAQHAGLGKDVLLIGADDSLELWDPARWREYDAQLTESVSQLTQTLAPAS
jgi:MraZ protein